MYDTQRGQPEPRRRVAAKDAPVLVGAARTSDEPLVSDDEGGDVLDPLPERLVVRLEHPLLRGRRGERRLELPDVEAGGTRQLEDHVTARRVDPADERRFAQGRAERRLARRALEPRRDEGGERGERRER